MTTSAEEAPEEGRGAAEQFWVLPGALTLTAVRLQPGGHLLDFLLRAGPAYRLDLRELGFADPVLFAMADPKGQAVVLALRTGGLVDVTSARLVAACDPAYREAMERPAVAPELFGARARARRLAAGLSVLETAAAAGMAPSNYARIEAGHHRPRLDTLERVAAALGAPLRDLLDGRG